MPAKITKTQRWLDLIAYLVGRRMAVTVDELMEAVPGYATRWRSENQTTRDTTRRAFERDKDELRELGIPIETVTATYSSGEQQEAYRLSHADFYLPYLKVVAGAFPRPRGPGATLRETQVELAPESALTAAEALRGVGDLPGFPYAREARSALRKLSLALRREMDLPPAPTLQVEPPGSAEVSRIVRALSEALLARKRVSFRYHGINRGEATDREVAPYGLFLQHGHWYLVAHDHAREALRVFRVDRMETPTRNPVSPKKPDYEIPSDFRLRDYLGRNAWEIGDDDAGVRALILFHFPASLWAERNGFGELQTTEADGSAVRAFEVRQVDQFVRWLLFLEGDAVVLHPPELRQALADRAADVARRHAPGSRRAEP